MRKFRSKGDIKSHSIAYIIITHVIIAYLQYTTSRVSRFSNRINLLHAHGKISSRQLANAADRSDKCNKLTTEWDGGKQ